MWQIIVAVISGGIIGSCITFVIMSGLNTKVKTPSASHNSARLAVSLLTRLEQYMSLHSKYEWGYVFMLLNEWRKETAAK